ncbi:hypothetical protein ACU4GD_14140 [Cupriavidus basilensis]
MAGGMADGKSQLVEFNETQLDTGKLTSFGDLFSEYTRAPEEQLYVPLLCGGGSTGDIRWRSAEEAIYPGCCLDAAGKPLDAAAARYRHHLHFDKDKLPPCANAFWSLRFTCLWLWRSAEASQRHKLAGGTHSSTTP